MRGENLKGQIMNWNIYHAYGMWVAENSLGSTVWAFTLNELKQCFNVVE